MSVGAPPHHIEPARRIQTVNSRVGHSERMMCIVMRKQALAAKGENPIEAGYPVV
jgi:hypothetical protein